MKNKALSLLVRSQTDVISLWKKNYNSKIAFKPIVEMPVFLAKKYFKFNNLLQLNEDFIVFDVAAPINWYYDYCFNCLTVFAKYPDVIVWCDSCRYMDNPVSLIVWDIIAIPIMSLECKRIFSSAGYLITPLQNRLKKDLIDTSECLNAWYKQESTTWSIK